MSNNTDNTTSFQLLLQIAQEQKQQQSNVDNDEKQQLQQNYITIFKSFNNQFNTIFDIVSHDNSIEQQNVQYIVSYLINQLYDNNSLFNTSIELHISVIEFIKIIIRTRYTLTELYSVEFIQHLVNNTHNNNVSNKDATNQLLYNKLSLESNKLLLNLFVTNHQQLLSLFQHNINTLVKPFINCYTIYCSNDTQHMNSNTESLYICTRILFYLTLNNDLCNIIANEYNIYSNLLDLSIQYTSPLPDNDTGHTCQYDNNDNIDDDNVDENQWTVLYGLSKKAIQNRQLIDQICKVYINLLTNINTTDSKQYYDNISIEQRKLFIEHIRNILAYNTTLPNYIQSLISSSNITDVNSITDENDKLAINNSANNQQTNNNQHIDNSISNTQSNDTQQQQQHSTTVSTHGASSWSSPELCKITDPYTRQLFEQLQIDESTHTSSQPSYRNIQVHICYIIMYTSNDICNILFDSNNKQSIYAIQCIINLFYQNLLWCEFHKNELHQRILPLSSSLHNIAKHSVYARKHIKINIFKQHAFKHTNTTTSTQSVRNTQQQQRMIPDGAFNERDVDTNQYTLRSLVSKYVTHLDVEIKSSISELLYILCDSNTEEYIRLLGFGRAIGLLSAKGLPGFNVSYQTTQHNIDELLQQGKKL